MANLNFWQPLSPLHPDYNPLITSDFESFTGEQWYPVHCSIASSSIVSLLTNRLPVEANGQVIPFIPTTSFFDDYYNRIHLTPSTLDLGNVASEQVSTVMLWNAYLNAKTLQSIDGLAEGITVSGQPAPPMSMTALQERAWNISVLVDGPSNIDTRLSWNFGSDQPAVHITGNRVVPFGFLVDWSKSVNEQLQWLTDIMQSPTGHEQRRALRIAPRMGLNAEFLTVGAERQFFELSMVGWGAKTYALPLWPQQQWLKTAHVQGAYIIYCDTQQRNFRANRLAMLRGDNCFENETVEIESVLADRLILKRPLQQSWPKGSCLTPAATAQLEAQPNITKRTDTMMRTNLSFTVTEPVDHVASLPVATYRGYPVFTDTPNEKNDLTHSYERLLATLDNQTGLALRIDAAGVAFSLFQYDWMTYGRVQQGQLRSLFYALKGRQKALWLPTFSRDLSIKTDINAGSDTLSIERCGYSRFGLKQLGRQDICIFLANGTTIFKRITSASEVDAKTERIAVDSPFSQNIQLKDIVRVSFLTLCRLNSDSVTIEHVNDSDGVAKASATFRGVRET